MRRGAMPEPAPFIRDTTPLMPSRRRVLLLSLLAGLLAGVGYPCVDLAWACRVPTSEACVWGKAYLPLTLGLSLVLLGGATAGVVYAWLNSRRKHKGGSDAA